MNETIKAQILEIRATGLTNMLDTNAVQRIANDMGFYELVCLSCLSDKHTYLENTIIRKNRESSDESIDSS